MVEIKLNVLTKHKANLENAKTFEEYKAAHIAYVDQLIARIEKEDATRAAVDKFIAAIYSKED